MTKKKTYAEKIKAGLAKLGIVTTVLTYDPADPPAPKSHMTGQQLADYFSNPKKEKTK
jgi:hypothetical protein